MTVITVFRRYSGIAGFTCSGHSGYAKRGADIVCAGVSALTQAACMGVERLVQADAHITVKDGELSLMLPETLAEAKREKAELILGTMLLGLRAMEEQYSDYLKLYEREV